MVAMLRAFMPARANWIGATFGRPRASIEQRLPCTRQCRCADLAECIEVPDNSAQWTQGDLLIMIADGMLDCCQSGGLA
jgi:hypothetical protein